MTSGPAQDEVRRLLGLIEEVDPLIRSVSAVNSHALADAETLDRETRGGPPQVAPPRTSRAGQGQHRHGRTRLDRGLARPRRRAAGARRTAGPPPARVRDGPPRQDEPQRVGQHPLRALDVGLERPRRSHPQPVRPEPDGVGIELGQRCGGRGPAGGVRRRHRDQRLDHRAGRGVRAGRVEADGRAGADRGRRADLVEPGLPGSDGADRRRHRRPAGRDGGDEHRRRARAQRARDADRRTARPVGVQPGGRRRLRAGAVDVVARRCRRRRRPRPAGAEGPRRRGRDQPDAGRAQGVARDVPRDPRRRR